MIIIVSFFQKNPRPCRCTFAGVLSWLADWHVTYSNLLRVNWWNSYTAWQPYPSLIGEVCSKVTSPLGLEQSNTFFNSVFICFIYYTQQNILCLKCLLQITALTLRAQLTIKLKYKQDCVYDRSCSSHWSFPELSSFPLSLTRPFFLFLS